MSDIVTGQIFSDGEKGITAAKVNGIIGKSTIQPDFYQNKPISASMDPADIFLLLKGNGTFARVQAANVSASVSGTLTLANPSQSGMLHQTTGNASDYCGGDNQFHPLASAVPTGTVLDFAGATIPASYLLCDGTVYPIATYPALGALLTNKYGGDGTTTFAVPDCRGRTAIGTGTGSGLTARTLAAKGGAESIVLAVGHLPSHTHGMDHYHNIAAGQFSHNHTAGDSGHQHQTVSALGNYSFQDGSHAVSLNQHVTADNTLTGYASIGIGTSTLPAGSTVSAAGTNGAYANTGATGSGTAVGLMQPFIVFNKVIKT
jgi:microcystin-dependent protein